ncbi:DUF732 domain-containing protein [Nocardioides terrigena]|uniref:DUF732 domain-containing protein n=1 Tax=Nocardioides terrigena TaxID=424797 RepID=UPI000D30ACD0|nr:DUF732 domain-containing protein [Nocardioides terrigena]
MLVPIRRLNLIAPSAALLVALLAGCGDDRPAADAVESSTSSKPPSPDTTVTETVTATPEEPESPTVAEAQDKEFWEGMEQGGESVPEDARATIADLGRTACVGFDMGKDITDIGIIMNDAGFTIEQAGHIVGSAIRAYCPEHDDQLSRP